MSNEQVLLPFLNFFNLAGITSYLVKLYFLPVKIKMPLLYSVLRVIAIILDRNRENLLRRKNSLAVFATDEVYYLLVSNNYMASYLARNNR